MRYVSESEIRTGMLFMHNYKPVLVIKRQSMYAGFVTVLRHDGTTALVNSLYITRQSVLSGELR